MKHDDQCEGDLFCHCERRADLERQRAGRRGMRKGMRTATDHAESEDPGWSDRAVLTVAACVAANPHPDRDGLIAPEIRNWCYEHGLDRPASEHAWGGVMKRARTQGIIVRTNRQRWYGDETIHSSPSSIWEAA